MNYLRKNINFSFYIFLTIFILLGFYLSLNVGISHDEYHEELYWNFNKEIVLNFFSQNIDYQSPFRDKFYGIGFNLLSQPFQILIKKIVPLFFYVDEYGAKLISKHAVVFILFSISGVYFKKILYLISNNELFSALAAILYLTYPYLFGHSMFNPKDIPFLAVWLILTYYNLYLINKFIDTDLISYKDLFIFAFITAFLISIRVSGVLIFLQYLLSFILIFNIKKINYNFFYNKLLLKLIFFIFTILVFVIIFYPVFWTNPLLLIDAIKFMSNFPQNICTLTFGRCLMAQNLDALYIPSWLIVKLPILILLGFFVIPFTEKKIFSVDKNQIFIGTILGTIIILPLIFIFLKTPLYDELRQILFLVPLFFVIGLISLKFLLPKYINKIISLFIIFFIFENFSTHPYQYSWFNLPTRAIDINKNFELDYWGISGKNISKKIINLDIKDTCIVVSPIYLVKPFLDDERINCYYTWQNINKPISRPFYGVQIVRNMKSSIPYGCNIIYSEFITLNFYNKKNLQIANLVECK